MKTLYPAIEPYKTHRVKVEEPHELYVEECGNPKGLSVVFVHGGPGFGFDQANRCFFDPKRYHIVLFDQRGAGKSTPHACLEKNTTQALVEDMEVIRKKLGIEKWVVFGGSWGSTLSLVYAQAHPEHVTALVVRGIFIDFPEEAYWLYNGGARYIYPDYYENYLKPLAGKKYDDIVKAYYELLTGKDEKKQLEAATEWSKWEGYAATLHPNKAVIEEYVDPHTALSVARIECHYFVNNCFLRKNQILDDMPKISHIPGYIVQGRYDMICPLKYAWMLHKAWTKAKLTITPNAGHSAMEVENVHNLVDATDEIAKTF
ncbi:MAG: prolyl aminopeptidase [Gammaproteobacteria bacterium RIFOXYB2_FULL_38_6]|nr:MAG: prolyl aminopeptidase [Gammaproteobacteria bacterium RIFOXYB2_FULL_38_6]